MLFHLDKPLRESVENTPYFAPIISETLADIKVRHDKSQESMYPIGYETLRKPFESADINLNLYGIEIDSRFVEFDGNHKVIGIRGISNFGEVHTYNSTKMETGIQETRIRETIRPEIQAVVSLEQLLRLARLSGVSKRIVSMDSKPITGSFMNRFKVKAETRLIVLNDKNQRNELKPLIQVLK
jgi:hypothetical protein